MIGSVVVCTLEQSIRLRFVIWILFHSHTLVSHSILQSLQKSMAHCLPVGADRGSSPRLQVLGHPVCGRCFHALTATSLVLQTDQLWTLDFHYAFLFVGWIDHLVRIVLPLGTTPQQQQWRLVRAARLLLFVLESQPTLLRRKPFGTLCLWKCLPLASIGSLYDHLCSDHRTRKEYCWHCLWRRRRDGIAPKAQGARPFVQNQTRKQICTNTIS